MHVYFDRKYFNETVFNTENMRHGENFASLANAYFGNATTAKRERLIGQKTADPDTIGSVNKDFEPKSREKRNILKKVSVFKLTFLLLNCTGTLRFSHF
jgi:hypothetical protein